VRRGRQLLEGVRELVARGRQVQLLGGDAPDRLAIHREPRGLRGGDDGPALGLEQQQLLRGDRLDLRHDQAGLLALDHRAQLRAIEHVDHVAAVRDLHRGRIGIAIARDHLDAKPLQLDHHFLA
jgi:hypothetical protein